MNLSAMKKKLESKKYREAFVREHIKQGIAFQIRAAREQQGWSQHKLGIKAGMKQVLISRYEDPDYGKYTLSTLMKLANALDVALIVRFAPFSELASWVAHLSSASLMVRNFHNDIGFTRFAERPAATTYFMKARCGETMTVPSAIKSTESVRGQVGAFAIKSTEPVSGAVAETIEPFLVPAFTHQIAHTVSAERVNNAFHS